MNRNATRGRATREHIVAVATDLFAADGYEATSIEAVMRASGVSKGALYHHFPGKDALFEAVLGGLDARIEAALRRAAVGVGTPAGLVRAGCTAWVRLAVDPVVQQIMLIDAPTVLGWQRWRERDEATFLGDLRRALAAAAEQGVLDRGHVDVFAHALLASANETALLVARADDPAAALAGAQDALDELLDRVLGGPRSAER
ncbi:TetR/AcrR family transcriptional regulator [Pseudonocardia humida]|uniref:TetR/AcrR family transcriptional regulator n=1 Tax=Pseudonocardia humida TaxID=2800819 RepID=A0ABT0ZS97_9PSEU|nr:TetR/AcrR family transcriptional regulator [Pseudonocardia humida]MCO1653579.1 TetR/AcrR family transcriptional regulator [Pseudonocardia humida]